MKATKRKLNIIDRLLLFINILFCAALLLSYLAPVINPEKCWQIAFLGLAYPLLLFGNITILIYWLLRRKYWALLPLVCILAGWNILQNNIGFHSGTLLKRSNANSLRMMTYNVHDFKKYGFNNDPVTRREMLQIIRDENPDVIGIQEFYTRRRGQYEMIDSLKRVMNTNYYYYVPLETAGNESIGMAVFSKLLIIAHGFIQLNNDPTSENQCLYIDIKKGVKTVRIYSLHLQSIRFDPEDYKYMDNLSGKSDMGSAKRLGGKLKLAFIERSKQVATIKRQLAQCTYPYIVSGDFNDTPTSYAVSEMSKGLKNAFREKGLGLGRTYNGDFPNFQIDYILASRQSDVAGYHITQKKLSDHFPVCSDLRLK